MFENDAVQIFSPTFSLLDTFIGWHL
jgi:hypothetical protein